MTSPSTNFQNYIFEDPQCPDQDDYHPTTHASINLGRVVLSNAIQQAQETAGAVGIVNLEPGIGMMVLWVLAAAERDPRWHRVLIDAIRASEYFNPALFENNIATILEGYPLSPLDLMEFSND